MAASFSGVARERTSTSLPKRTSLTDDKDLDCGGRAQRRHRFLYVLWLPKAAWRCASRRTPKTVVATGHTWAVPPSRERQGRNPKPEMLERGFGLRYSAFFRVSAFGIRIWAAGGGWYFPDAPVAAKARCLAPPGMGLESGQWREAGSGRCGQVARRPATSLARPT
jgi:hypothetical protein